VLAFVWIIVAIFIQREELLNQNKELQLANRLFELQSAAMAEQVVLLREERSHRNSERAYDFAIVLVRRIEEYATHAFPRKITFWGGSSLQLFSEPLGAPVNLMQVSVALKTALRHCPPGEKPEFDYRDLYAAMRHIRSYVVELEQVGSKLLQPELARLELLGTDELISDFFDLFELLDERLGEGRT